MDIEMMTFVTIYEKCYKEICDERLKEIVNIFRINYHIWPDYVDSLKSDIVLLFSRLSQNKVSPLDFKLIYEERCDFLICFLLEALPQELYLRGLTNEEIRRICQSYEYERNPVEIEIIPSYMRINVTNLCQLIYDLSSVILTNFDVHALWINNVFAYTSPSPFMSEEEWKQIEAFWKTQKDEAEFLRNAKQRRYDSLKSKIFEIFNIHFHMFNAFEKDWKKTHVEAKKQFKRKHLNADKWLEFIVGRYGFILNYFEILRSIPGLLHASPEEVKMCCQLYPQIYDGHHPPKVESIGDYLRIHTVDVISRIYAIPLMIIAYENIKSMWFSIEDSDVVIYASREMRPDLSRREKIMTLWHQKTAGKMKVRSPIAKGLREIFAIYKERYSLTADWASNLKELVWFLCQTEIMTGKSVFEGSIIMKKRCNILMDYVKNMLSREFVKRNLKSQDFKKFGERLQALNSKPPTTNKEWILDFMRIETTDTMIILYFVPIQILQNRDVNSVWFSVDGKFAYTSPERNPSDQEKKRIMDLWKLCEEKKKSKKKEISTKMETTQKPRVEEAEKKTEDQQVAPVLEQSFQTKSMTEQSMTDRSMIDRSMIDQSMIDRSMIDRSMIDQSMIDRSMIDPSMIDQSMQTDLPKPINLLQFQEESEEFQKVESSHEEEPTLRISDLICSICDQEYEIEEKYPMTMVPCGHSACKMCFQKLTNCPKCLSLISFGIVSIAFIGTIKTLKRRKESENLPETGFQAEKKEREIEDNDQQLSATTSKTLFKDKKLQLDRSSLELKGLPQGWTTKTILKKFFHNGKMVAADDGRYDISTRLDGNRLNCVARLKNVKTGRKTYNHCLKVLLKEGLSDVKIDFLQLDQD